MLVVTLGVDWSLLDHGLEGDPFTEDPSVLHIGFLWLLAMNLSNVIISDYIFSLLFLFVP